MRGVVFALTPGGRTLALKLRDRLDFEVRLPGRLAEEGDGSVVFESLPEALAGCFRAGRPLVLIMAVGIAVRLLAPLLRDKQRDPAVVVMDEAGRFAIPLLSGHWGGANELASRLSGLTGGVAVITTATDVRGLPAIDLAARELGAVPEPFTLVRSFNAGLLRGEPAALFGADPDVFTVPLGGLAVLPLTSLQAARDRYRHCAVLTHLAAHPDAPANCLYLRPRNLYVGVGCRRGVAARRILAFLKEVLGRSNLALGSVAALASIAAKRTEKGLLAAAAELEVPLLFFEKEEIIKLDGYFEKSPFVQKVMGVGGVCEPAAMLAAKGGRLLVPRQQKEGVTVAVAVSP